MRIKEVLFDVPEEYKPYEDVNLEGENFPLIYVIMIFPIAFIAVSILLLMFKIGILR